MKRRIALLALTAMASTVVISGAFAHGDSAIVTLTVNSDINYISSTGAWHETNGDEGLQEQIHQHGSGTLQDPYVDIPADTRYLPDPREQV